jgi:hypothetical protein
MGTEEGFGGGRGRRHRGRREPPERRGAARKSLSVWRRAFRIVSSVVAARRCPSEWLRLLGRGEERIKVRSPDGDIVALSSEV